MNSHLLTIALKEFRDRMRSGWVVACVLVWLGAIALTSLLGLVQMGRIGVLGYERTTVTLLNLTQYLVPLLGLLVGHDLIVREREERTLHLVLASGVTRARLLLGKFLGGAVTVAMPLLIGFTMAGVMIGIAARDRDWTPFLKLAFSGLLLGIIFCGVGVLASTFSRSRVQALVTALLAWCIAVFAFDLVALGIITSTKAVHAAQEIEVFCEATHVNSGADIHRAFDTATVSAARETSQTADGVLAWVWFNPVDVFRLVNLPSALGLNVPVTGALFSFIAWLALVLAAATWRLNRIDL